MNDDKIAKVQNSSALQPDNNGTNNPVIQQKK